MPDQFQNQLKTSLDATGLPAEQKAALWRAYDTSNDSQTLTKALGSIPVSDEIKAAIFDIKAAVAQGQQPNFGIFPKSQTVAPPAAQTQPAVKPAPTMGQNIETGLLGGAASGASKLLKMGQNLGRPIEAVKEAIGLPSVKAKQDQIINSIKQYGQEKLAGNDSMATQVAAGAGSMPFDIARFAVAAPLPIPPAMKMALVEGLTEADQGLGNAIWASIKGGAAGMAMKGGEGLADKFIQKYAQNAPEVVKKIVSALGGGAGLSGSNQAANAISGNPVEFKQFIKDAISGAGLSMVSPNLQPKILQQTPAPPAVAPKVTVNNSNSTVPGGPVRSRIAPKGKPAGFNGTPVTPPLKPEVVEPQSTAVIPASRPQASGKSRFNVSPEGQAADAAAPPPAPKQITGAVKPPAVEVLPEPKALPAAPEAPQIAAPTPNSANAAEEVRGATGISADKGVIYDLSALPAAELVAIRPVAQKAYEMAQDEGTKAQAASRLNAVNFLLFNKAVAGEPGLEPAQYYRDSHIATPDPVIPAVADTPEQIAVKAGGKVENGVISDETGVPTMKVTEEPKTKVPDEPIKVKAPAAKEAVIDAKPAENKEVNLRKPAEKAAKPVTSEEVTEVIPDPKTMKVPTAGGSMTLAKGDTAYSHKGKVYVATPKGKDVIIENEDGHAVTVPVSGTVAETVSKHLGASYKPAGTAAPPAKGASVESNPVAKATEKPPVQKEAAPKAKAAGAEGGERTATAAIPVAKPSKKTEPASEPAVPKTTDLSAEMRKTEFHDKIETLLDNSVGSEIHKEFADTYMKMYDAIENDKHPDAKTVARLGELIEKAEKLPKKPQKFNSANKK